MGDKKKETKDLKKVKADAKYVTVKNTVTGLIHKLPANLWPSEKNKRRRDPELELVR